MFSGEGPFFFEWMQPESRHDFKRYQQLGKATKRDRQLPSIHEAHLDPRGAYQEITIFLIPSSISRIIVNALSRSGANNATGVVVIARDLIWAPPLRREVVSPTSYG
jgi:hypothetical protein